MRGVGSKVGLSKNGWYEKPWGVVGVEIVEGEGLTEVWV